MASQQLIWLNATGALQCGNFGQSHVFPLTSYLCASVYWLTSSVSNLAVPGALPGGYCCRIHQTEHR